FRKRLPPLGFGAITAAISFMKSFAKRSMILLGILAFVIFVMPMDGVSADNTNSTLSATTNLHARTFKVDPNLFYQALGVFPTNAVRATNNYSDVGGVHKAEMSGSEEAVVMAAKTFFRSLGADLTAPGKSIFFNDRLSLLLVRATDQDLDTIERAVRRLNTAPPQIHIKARFVEVTPDKIGVSTNDWYLGQFGASVNPTVSGANPLDTFRGNPTYSR